MREDRIRQQDSALLQGLALLFMGRHSPSQAHWKLSATKYKGKLGSAAAEGNAWKQVSLTLGAACEDPDIQEPFTHSHNKAAAAVANAALLVEVPQDYHHSSHTQT